MGKGAKVLIDPYIIQYLNLQGSFLEEHEEKYTITHSNMDGVSFGGECHVEAALNKGSGRNLVVGRRSQGT